MRCEIRRVEAARQPYPKSGNFSTQRTAYNWELWIGGRCMNTFPRLRDAKQAAKDYSGTSPVIIR